MRLSLEAFPRGFPTGLSHVPPWCESILGLKVETVQGKQVSLEWTETSGGLWELRTILESLSPFISFYCESTFKERVEAVGIRCFFSFFGGCFTSSHLQLSSRVWTVWKFT